MELFFPLEFIVRGTPASVQGRPEGRAAWKARVRQASYQALPEAHFCTEEPVSVTLLYFPASGRQADLDNIIKPILDALCRHIYKDDRQVERLWAQKFEPGSGFPFRNPSAVLAMALAEERPLMFIRLGNDPTEGAV